MKSNELFVRLIFLLLNVFSSMRSDDDFYPRFWNDVPNSISAFPLLNGSRTIDPWFYPHRLALYKILIEFSTPLMPFCSSSNASNILFALPSQFAWQFESNRLFSNGTLSISTRSWWAAANYYLSVVPFLAAVHVGLIPAENFRLVRQENFCTTIDECFAQVPRATSEWRRFFLQLQRTNFSRTIDDETIDEVFLQPLWAASIASIDESLPLIEEKSVFLPSSVERFFGYAWARLLHLIALTRKNTNLYETRRNQRTFLPRRMLTDGDFLRPANDFSPPVQRSLTILFSFQFEWLSLIETIWKRLNCNYPARRHAQRVLETMGQSKLLALQSFLQAVLSAILSPCDRSQRTDL